ncbi:Oxidoreductase [Kitasatospora sp. MMS16-BH015]|uniref:FAD-dependent oxidoreductase n=1 Tax=Kitasatospora sp. MMS16-BH015 TaxID=2018025 RepID=UPI000CA09B35|nr:FAD-dependent oxidoreductase [Kitasatospora sp. MMS16-BH015]AUG75558.1 Oxidoreductase [Kitasatospora sp. MMS16-BH015]
MTGELSAQVCVVGGGPAGLTLGLELARQGVEVVVVEQSDHFDRSFRGESISPDSVWLLDRIGLLDGLRGSLLEVRGMEITDRGRTVLTTDFSRLPYPFPCPVELPQPVLLAALAEAADEHAGFTLLRGTRVVELLTDGGTVTGVHGVGPAGAVTVRAAVTVAADGRFSKVRELAGLRSTRIPLGRDVIWLKLPFPREWSSDTYRVRIEGEHHGLFIPTYPDQLRVGLNIPQGGLRALREAGIGALHRRLDALAPECAQSVRTVLHGWANTTVLKIFTTVVPQWSRPGLVLVGDAAHTLSPVLGQGVNHAVVDAVALAGLLGPVLAGRAPGEPELTAALAEFQRGREASVARSRDLQLRQEEMFARSRPLAMAGRRALYRIVDHSPALQRRILAGVYYQLQEQALRSAHGEPARTGTPSSRPVPRGH